MTIHVLLCDDHQILRDGLRNLLNAEADIRVIGEASDGLQAIEMVDRMMPDIILMDINMPNQDGVQTVEQLSLRFPHVRIIMLTMFAHEEYLFRTIRAGARGYVLKDSPIQFVVDSIRKVMNGGSVLHPNMAQTHVDYHPNARELENSLSPREQEVLGTVVKGLSNKEIAEYLFISETTVKLHISNVYRKLGVKSRSQAVMHAIRYQLVEIPNTT